MADAAVLRHPARVLSPLAFLSRPGALAAAPCTATGARSRAAPNFAYELCVRKVQDAELEGLDLGSWRVALNGSEAVSPDTVERFIRRFAPHGFRPGTLSPAYGLAEVGVALTFPPVGRPPHIESIGREHFTRQARPGPLARASPRCASCPAAGRCRATRCASWATRARRSGSARRDASSSEGPR